MLRDLGPQDAPALDALLDADPERRRIRGRPRSTPPADARAILAARSGDAGDRRRATLGAWIDGHLLAVVDLLVDWPEQGNVHLFVLHVHAGYRRIRLGRLVHLLVVSRLADDHAISTLSVALPPGHASEPFWRALGYCPRPVRRRRGRRTVVWARPVR